MALDKVGLARLLGILPRPLKQRIALVRADARKAVLRERKLTPGDGPDFYTMFWADAKRHVFGLADLREATKQRIKANRSRRSLYPVLTEQFLRWHETAFDGAPTEIEPLTSASGTCNNVAGDAVILVYGALAWKAVGGSKCVVYPYFSKDQPLTLGAARLGRWSMMTSMKDLGLRHMSILDVLRNRLFDNDNCPLAGNEEEIIAERFGNLLREWEVQKKLIRLM